MNNDELLNRNRTLRNKINKTFGQVNKFAALSAKGKCSEEEWNKAIDSLENFFDEVFDFMIDVREFEMGLSSTKNN